VLSLEDCPTVNDHLPGGGIEKRGRKITIAKSQMENPIPFHPFHSIPPSDITIKYPIQISKSIG
jgi:hypothetical protein